VENDRFEYRSKRFKISCTSDVIKLNDQSTLRLGFGYSPIGRSIVWDVATLFLNEDSFKSNGFKINRNIKVGEEVDDADLNHWKRVMEGDKPYDMKSYLLKDNTAISAVYKNPSAVKTSASPSVLYDVTYVKSGIVEQAEMEAGLNKIVKNLTVLESE